jgi:hypothetical protein
MPIREVAIVWWQRLRVACIALLSGIVPAMKSLLTFKAKPSGKIFVLVIAFIITLIVEREEIVKWYHGHVKTVPGYVENDWYKTLILVSSETISKIISVIFKKCQLKQNYKSKKLQEFKIPL